MAPALVCLGACRVPALEQPPFAMLEAGRVGLVVKQPLANQHDLEGEFEVGPVPDPLGGPDNFFFVEDEGEVLGRYELSLGVRAMLADSTSLEFGVGYRQYDIEGLQPAPDPDIRFLIETVDSLQFHAALRHYFEGPGWLSDRWRWFAELGLVLIPGVSVDSELQFLTTSQPISSSGEAFRVLTLTAGTAYQWSDSLLFEGGLTYEEPLEDLVVDLSSSVTFGPGQVIDVPIEASMRPEGALIFVALTWFPLPLR